jgi:hypothetical protein
MTVGEDGLYVVYEGRIAKCGVPHRHTKEGSDMPYIAHDTNVIYAAADTAAAARAEAEKDFEKDLRNRRPPENIDVTLKSLEVHEATTALVNGSNSWVKWAYLKNGVACTPAEANDEDYRLGIAAATDGK